MPLRLYRCRCCGLELERFEVRVDAVPPPCPRCRTEALEAVVSPPALRFLGPGWTTSAGTPAPRKEPTA